MTTRIPLQIFQVDQDGFHIKLMLKINNRPAEFILDTGASKTVIDHSAITEYFENPDLTSLNNFTSGIGTNSMESHLVTIDEIKLGKLVINNFPCAVLDLQHVNFAYDYLNLGRVAGVLGGDILTRFRAVINYDRQVLILKEPAVDG